MSQPSASAAGAPATPSPGGAAEQSAPQETPGSAAQPAPSPTLIAGTPPGHKRPASKHKAEPRDSLKAVVHDSFKHVPRAIERTKQEAGAAVQLTRSEEASAAAHEEAAAGCRRQDFHVHARVQRKEARGTDKQLDLEWSLCGGWLASPKAWWRHPVARLAVPWLVLLQDFYIYGEDPLNDSHVRANYPGMGHVMGIVTIWAASSAAFAFLRFLFTLASIMVGIVAGRWFGYVVLAKWCKISAFSGSEGQLVTVPLVICFFLAVSAVLYTLMTGDTIDGASMEFFYVLGAPDLQYRTVSKYFQALSVTVDFLAIVMISDQVMQDFYHYPEWANFVKKWWVKKSQGWARILLTWLFLLTAVVVCVVAVFRTGKEDGDIQWTSTALGGTSETVRSFLAALIIFTDLVTTAQDWDFPTYRGPLDIAVPNLIAGTNLEQLVIRLPEPCVRGFREVFDAIRWDGLWERLPSAAWFSISISGKWLAYGPLLGVMGVDLLCAKTQVLYEPKYYGQYASPKDDRIWVIVDEDFLARAYTRGNLNEDMEGLVSYAARRDPTTGLPLDASAATDVELNGRYVESLALDYFFFLLGIGLIVGFCVMLKWADWRRAKLVDRAHQKLMKVTTTLAEQADVGCSTLQLASEEGLGVGDTVEMHGLGSEMERKTISSLRPLTLDSPLIHCHPAGSTVDKVVLQLEVSRAPTELSFARTEISPAGRPGQQD